MSIKYYRLFDLLKEKNMKKTDLLEIMSSSTLAKLQKGDIVKTDTIQKICVFLNCQPADIMESYMEEEIFNPKTGKSQIVEKLTGIEEMEKFNQELRDSDLMKLIIESMEKAAPGTIERFQEILQKKNDNT